MSRNPYRTPMHRSSSSSSGPTHELARRFTRFSAALVDGLLALLIILPVQLQTNFFERVRAQAVGIGEQIFMTLFGMAVSLLLNGYLLYSRGQTIGKLSTKIQIVDHKTSKLLPFYRVYLLRYLWTLPIVPLVIFIPGEIDNMIMGAVIWIGILLIFTDSQRCLHDHFAGSDVVLYKPDRERL